MKKFLIAASLVALMMVALPEAEAHPPTCPPYQEAYTIWNGVYLITLCRERPVYRSSHYRYYYPRRYTSQRYRSHPPTRHYRPRHHRRHQR